MPEIGEVARVVHYLRKHIVGRRIASVQTRDDDIVYGKVGCSATDFSRALSKGRVVKAAGQQGKYFWLEIADGDGSSVQKSKRPAVCAVLHFGMTGWMEFSNDESYYYERVKKEGEAKEWPPRFWKFVLKMEGEESGVETAFVDARRLGRIRLVEAAGDEVRKMSPLKENGPDPIIDRDIFTEQWLAEKMKTRRVPVKAFLLDQANMSGVGNWVGDEILYQARIHPEQYCNSFTEYQIQQLHRSIMHVCGTAVDTLSDTTKFPENWLMTHRWAKGKSGTKLPNGDSISFVKVGGRTSAFVPKVQKKSGPVPDAAVEVDAADQKGDTQSAAPVGKKAVKAVKGVVGQVKAKLQKMAQPASKASKRKRGAATEGEEADAVETGDVATANAAVANGRKRQKSGGTAKAERPATGRRKSARIAGV